MDGPDTLRARLFDRDGAPTSGEIVLLRPVGQHLSSVVALPGGFAVVWDQANPQRLYSVFARIFDRTGSPRGRPFKVHANSPSNRLYGQAAPTPDGGFAVTWNAFSGTIGERSRILARFFDVTGNPLGPPPVDPTPPTQRLLDPDRQDLIGMTVGRDGVLSKVFVGLPIFPEARSRRSSSSASTPAAPRPARPR
ncbi:MAG TPA: hypothetical protein VHR45_23985 [Thermoanaerobaculia bacterium]|nr:hypothetical protein [Thermoanaerobaculia bacterium]